MKICAILSVFNEEDVIQDCLDSLVSQNIDFFIIDNGCTDKTIDIVRAYRGRGLVGIQKVIFVVDEMPVFSLKGIQKLKQEISCKLNYDWYINADADEMRYSPWVGCTLSEGIERVDSEGYNLINFALFNFELTEDESKTGSIENKLNYYSPAEVFNTLQVRAWRKCQDINLVDSAGHYAKVAQPKVYPVRFILKHYPVRSIEQAREKILKNRIKRFSPAEKKIGWHVQYDHLKDAEAFDSKVVKNKNELLEFDHIRVCENLQAEALSNLILVHSSGKKFEEHLKSEKTVKILGPDPVNMLFKIERILRSQKVVNISLPEKLIFDFKHSLRVFAAYKFLQGDALMYELTLEKNFDQNFKIVQK